MKDANFEPCTVDNILSEQHLEVLHSVTGHSRNHVILTLTATCRLLTGANPIGVFHLATAVTTFDWEHTTLEPLHVALREAVAHHLGAGWERDDGAGLWRIETQAMTRSAATRLAIDIMDDATDAQRAFAAEHRVEDFAPAAVLERRRAVGA